MAGIKEKIVNLEDLKEAYDDLTLSLSTKVDNGNILKCKMWYGTKEEYEAIEVKDDSTLYNITNDEGIIGDYLVSAKVEKDKLTIKNSKDVSVEFTKADKVGVGNIENCQLWSGTREEYDALPTKSPNVLYNVLGEDLTGKEYLRDATISGNTLTLTKGTGSPVIYTPDIPAAMDFKGTCLQAALPTSGQAKGDYWKLSDETGTYAGQCAIWDGTQWQYSSSNISIDKTITETGTNPVEGKAIYNALANKVDKEAGKGLFSGSYNDLTNKPDLNYLPLAGGTMTGSISIKKNGQGIKMDSDSADYIEVVGGTGNSQGASLVLFNRRYHSLFSGMARLGCVNADGTSNAWLYVKQNMATYSPIGGTESKLITANDIRVDKMTVHSGEIPDHGLVTKDVLYTIPANYKPVAVTCYCDSNEVIMCGTQGEFVNNYIGTVSDSDRTITLHLWWRSFYTILVDGRNIYLAIELVKVQ